MYRYGISCPLAFFELGTPSSHLNIATILPYLWLFTSFCGVFDVQHQHLTCDHLLFVFSIALYSHYSELNKNSYFQKIFLSMHLKLFKFFIFHSLSKVFSHIKNMEIVSKVFYDKILGNCSNTLEVKHTHKTMEILSKVFFLYWNPWKLFHYSKVKHFTRFSLIKPWKSFCWIFLSFHYTVLNIVFWVFFQGFF